jgi:hypothetical protein
MRRRYSLVWARASGCKTKRIGAPDRSPADQRRADDCCVDRAKQRSTSKNRRLDTCPADPPDTGSSSAPISPCIGTIRRVLLTNQATDRLAVVFARKSITMRTTPTACPRALKGSGAVRTAQPASIPNHPRPTFQISIMRNVSRRSYRGAPGVKG